jgi:uncharacterized protein with beta-barrel porin domain
VWISGEIGNLNAGSGNGPASFESHRQTITAGLEMTGDNLRWGVSYRYAKNDISLEARGSSANLVSNGAFAYLGFTTDGFRIASGVGYSAFTLNTDRRVAFGGLNDRLHSDGDGQSWVAFTEAAYLVPLGEGLRVGPYLGGSVSAAVFDKTREWGGATALNAGRMRTTTTLVSYGMRGSAALGGVTLSGDLGARSYLGDAGALRAFGFVDTGKGFETRAGEFGRTTFAGRIDASTGVGRFIVGLGLRGESGSGGSSYGARASAGFRF